jgi:hypothetical protein
MTVVPISYPHLITDEGEVRLERLPRIRVSMIAADHLGHGWSADQIAEQYPHLRLAEIHSALAYYYDHKTEIEAILEEELGNADRSEPSPFRLKLLKAKRDQ